ncbi:Sugar phosphate exchanger 3 [Toxocara canis]|uniref:Sugar phosphate exchanger 3 n=1 Tax=Toxocara canis TaxID=6265 RepID=A0A0B2V419_TOXCA|nr:Sugar phosphate exchanger 3 [Toxocara canis]
MRQRKKAIVFVVTFISYAMFHASRKTLSGVKASVTADWTRNTTNASHFNNPFMPSVAEAETLLGLLDALFMVAYAISLFYWGWLGDRLNPRNVIAFGMVGSAAALVSFGSLPKWFGFYSTAYYLLTYIIFGLLQACGWPNEVAIMGNWFGGDNRGFVMGLWAACQPIGNIIGSLLIAVVLPFGYEYTFVFNSSLMVLGALVVALAIEERPQRESDQTSGDEMPTETEAIDVHSEGTPVGLFEALLLPSVIPYCLTNICLKLVNYAFFFWLPFYLTANYGWTERDANALSIWYDIGGIMGSVTGGFISDRMGCRSPVIVAMLLASLGALFCYNGIGGAPILNAIVMTVVGVTVSGPYNLIVGAICVDLGTQPLLSSNAQAMATVSGIIDGTGSAGSAVGQFVIPLMENQFGWNSVFYLFILMNSLALLCLGRRCYIDVVSLLATRPQLEVTEREPLLGSSASA